MIEISSNTFDSVVEIIFSDIFPRIFDIQLINIRHEHVPRFVKWTRDERVNTTRTAANVDSICIGPFLDQILDPQHVVDALRHTRYQSINRNVNVDVLKSFSLILDILFLLEQSNKTYWMWTSWVHSKVLWLHSNLKSREYASTCSHRA